MTVVEISPGGGYWTEILGPYLKDKGTYYTALSRAGHGELEQEARRQQGALGRGQGHRVRAKDKYDVAPAGSADLVITSRNVHNWMGAGFAGRGVRRVLQGAEAGRHPERRRASRVDRLSRRIRRPPTATCARITRSRWPRRPASSWWASSEALANPKDTKDWPKGVWTLPPTLALGETGSREVPGDRRSRQLPAEVPETEIGRTPAESARWTKTQSAGSTGRSRSSS